MIDLRSDTVSLPSEEMRKAMYLAELGDDVMGDDPTVRALEDRAAALVDKEAALFVPSGTQANLIAILVHCQRGDEIILGSESHIFHYELAGFASVGGVQARLVPNLPNGYFDMEQLVASFRPASPLFPPTTLVCLENTQNRCSGAVIDIEHIAATAKVAHTQGAVVHMDGARLFNAAIVLNRGVEKLAEPVDSVSFSLSKGLGAPAGALLCGSFAFIQCARRWRKTLGGAMHQAGVLAAAGLYGLDHMLDRLVEDHVNARLLAEKLAVLAGIEVRTELVRTNIVIVHLVDERLSVNEVLARLEAMNVLALPFNMHAIRLVTHKDIKRKHIDLVVKALKSTLENIMVFPDISQTSNLATYKAPLRL